MKRRDNPDFYARDHAYWTTELLDINPHILRTERGKIIQEVDLPEMDAIWDKIKEDEEKDELT